MLLPSIHPEKKRQSVNHHILAMYLVQPKLKASFKFSSFEDKVKLSFTHTHAPTHPHTHPHLFPKIGPVFSLENIRFTVLGGMQTVSNAVLNLAFQYLKDICVGNSVLSARTLWHCGINKRL